MKARTTPHLSFFLLLALALAAMATVRCTTEKSPAAVESVGFRGPRRDGAFAGTLPHRRPQAVWTFATGAPIQASPIWVDGAVIVGSGDGNLYAVDGETGDERWRFHTGGPIDGPAAYASGVVAIESRDGNLYGLDARNGRERWRVPLGADLPHPWGWDFLLSGPAAAGDRFFAGSGHGEVLAMDAASGKVLWRYATAGRVRSSPAVSDGVLYVGSFDGHLYALDAARGTLRWRFATQGAGIDSEKEGFDRRSVQSSPAVTADLVVVGCRDGFLYGVERATGKQRWAVDHQVSWVVGSPAIAGDRAIVGSSDGHFVHAVELATGKELWRTRTESNALSSPAVAGDVAVLGEFYGNVLGLDVATGRELWRFPTGELVNSSPLVRQGRIYVGSGDGKLYALAGDLAAPAKKALRAVYYEVRSPYRQFQGDRALRDLLVGESYEVLNRRNLADFLHTRVADRRPSVVVFATDALPTPVVDEAASGGALIRRYLDAGGKAIWVGGVPFLLHFDPQSLELVQPKMEDLQRMERVLGVKLDTSFEGFQQVRATSAGRRWGLPETWWVEEAEVSSAKGLDVLATDVHGHPAVWAKRFGGPDGTGWVSVWGRDRPLPDPRIVLSLAEYGLP
jgi:eukaryotic-like serine/threonine-protein kinase